jgi:hypothetical protein
MNAAPMIHGLLSGSFDAKQAQSDPSANPYLNGERGPLVNTGLPQQQPLAGLNPLQAASLEMQRRMQQWQALVNPAYAWGRAQIPQLPTPPQMTQLAMQPPAPPVPFRSGAPKHRPAE